MKDLEEQVTCANCGALVLWRTADKTGGCCMPCKNGTRESMEAARLYYQQERELDRTDPYRLLWKELVQRESSSKIGYGGLNDAERKYFAVNIVVGAVYRGGFHSYFYNFGSEYIADAEAGMEEMAATESLSLLRRAKQIVFGDVPIPDSLVRTRKILLKWNPDIGLDELDEVDRLFWEDPDHIAERQQSFARKNSLV